jgi:uncharacterized Zn finger protein
MATQTTLDESQIRDHVGADSFERGWPYFQRRDIFDARRQGATLKAHCRGSSGGPYRVEATLEDGQITDSHCSCPVGGGGRCKHVAALLLTWQAQRETFAPVEELTQTLERRSKAELIVLIQQMLRQEPELEPLLEMPLPVPGKRARTRGDFTTYRRQAATIFERADFSEWGAAREIAEQLAAIQEIGDRFLEQHEYVAAAAVYRAVAEEVLENFETFDDEAGDLSGVIGACVEGLGKCLTGEREDVKTREAMLRTLLDVVQADRDMGSIGMGDAPYDVLVQRTTPEERRMVAGWLRERAAAGEEDEESGDLDPLLFDLEADTYDDEIFLQRSRELQRTAAVVDRLLALGRRDEALAEARAADGYDLIPVADALVEHAEDEVAEQMVWQQARKGDHTGALEWLKERSLARDDIVSALELAEQLFRQHPTLERYRELRFLAGTLDQWPSLRSKLHRFLKPPHHAELVIRIALEEDDVDRALEVVRSQYHAEPDHLHPATILDVAQAAEPTRPRAALDLYQREAEARIHLRGRDHYREAARLLTHARTLYDHLGEHELWERYIATVREKYRTLPALKDELAAARL